MEGWIKLHRKFLEWEWFATDNMVKLFIFLLLSANHKDGKWRGIDVKRGQLITGLRSLNEKTKISIQSLRTNFDRLKRTGEINIKVTNKYSIITICNYDSYQGGQQASNTQTNIQLTHNQHTTNNKQERKNKKKEKNIPSFFEFKDYAMANKPGVNPQELKLKYEAWKENGWKDGHDKLIKNWKTKLLHTLPHISNEHTTPQKTFKPL